MQILQTARLTLRRFTADDAEFIHALLNEPSFLRFIGDRGVRTVEDAARYIADGPVASYAQHGFGLYLVCLTQDGTAIGMCGLLKRDSLVDVDLGFAFLPAHGGNGYARESARAVIGLAREEFALSRIVAIVSPDNAASIAVLEALDFRFERVHRLALDREEVRVYNLSVELERQREHGA